MDNRDASTHERRDLKALLRTLQDVGLVEAEVIDGTRRYRVTDLGRALSADSWMELVISASRVH